MNEIVAMNGVTFSYRTEEGNARKALDGITLSVQNGEWIAVVGHNGSGKSTLAKQMIGLLFPDEGKIRLFGEELTEENLWEIRSNMGIVFQNPDNQFVGSTVQDDVAFALENKGVPFEQMKQRVQAALEQVNMADFLNHEPHHLSGGQKQRVAIAGALALQPQLLILDEATSMLDPQGRNEVIRVVEELKRQTGLTVISITHDLEEALLADRVLVMNGGRLLTSGTPEEIFSRGEELEKIGLDLPFALKVSTLLRNAGLPMKENLMTEEELVKELWTSHFSK